MGKTLRIVKSEKTRTDEGTVLTFTLDAHAERFELWYRCDAVYDDYVIESRADCAVAGLFLSAMKAGYDKLVSEVSVSEKLYYQLSYHVIPQLHVAGRKKTPEISIEAPLTSEAFAGPKVACGLSRGVDSFTTLAEYGKDFELEEYRINAVTYYQAGAHGHIDGAAGDKARAVRKFELELAKTREFCERFGYELVVVSSNIDDVLRDVFGDDRFYRTHTLRNVSMTLFLQALIGRYYYSAACNLDTFKFIFNTDMARYEKWLLPLVGTESTSFYSSGRNWSRLEKISECLRDFEECHDYLQVCLARAGNCLACKKCKRTLMELDVLGDEVLHKFDNSFDIERYKKTCREPWFDEIFEYKDGPAPDAGQYDELFAYAAENRPELLGDLIRDKRKRVKKVKVTGKVAARKHPSKYAASVGTHEKGDRFRYLGESGAWVAVEHDGGATAFIPRNKVRLTAWA